MLPSQRYPRLLLLLFLIVLIYSNHLISLFILIFVLNSLIYEINKTLGLKIELKDLIIYLYNSVTFVLAVLLGTNALLLFFFLTLIGNFFIYYYLTLNRVEAPKFNTILIVAPQIMAYIILALEIVLSVKCNSQPPINGKIIVLTLCAVELQDYFGKFFGTRLPFLKYIGRVSPNKTISGTVFGFLISFLLVILIATVFHLFLKFYTIILILISGIFGDLYFSNIKRIYGVKDYGSILGYQGGLLDRLDSLMFPIIAVYFIIIKG